MNHPSQIIAPEYEALLPSVQIVPARLAEVNATYERILRHLDAGSFSLTDSTITQGVEYLASKNLLTPGRAAAILTGTPPTA